VRLAFAPLAPMASLYLLVHALHVWPNPLIVLLLLVMVVLALLVNLASE